MYLFLIFLNLQFIFLRYQILYIEKVLEDNVHEKLKWKL